MAKVLPKMPESLLMAWIQSQKIQTRYLENSNEPWKLENVLMREQSGSLASQIHWIFS